MSIASNQQQTPAAGAGPKLEETAASQSITCASQCEASCDELLVVSQQLDCTTDAASCSLGLPATPGSGNPPEQGPPPELEEPQTRQQDVRHSVQHSTLPTQTSSSIPNTDTRTHVVGELYDTERSYVESLQILVEKYMKPLKSSDSCRMLIESNLVDEIFYAIPKILQHHEIFLSALQDRISSDWDTSRVIGNVFIEAFTNQQIIDIYTAFINNWKNARQAIKIATQAKPAFERFLEAMSREHRNKLTLDALLIMPVQRIPRYELLIKELIKHTPEDHPDYEPLIEAQKQIHELALKIDHAEREMIHQEQLKNLECLIDGHVELQHPQRDFIRYDLVTITGASSLAMARKERVLFLFCDLLIMTSVKKKASRRSNLQTAFTNSFNDLSLLEGNKFKLLLRMPLDQIEVRLSNEQTQNYQQQQQEQQMAHLQQQQNKYIQERKSRIGSDLCIISQIEALSLKLHWRGPELSKLEEITRDLSNQLKLSLFELEQVVGAEGSAGNQLANSVQLQQSQSPSSTDLHANQSQLSLSGSGSISGAPRPPVHQDRHSQQQQPTSLGPSLSFNSSSSYVASNQASAPTSSIAIAAQDTSNTSLEFLINSSIQASGQSSSAWDNGQPGNGSTGEAISGRRGYIVASSLTSGAAASGATPQTDNGAASSLLATCESLLVTFSSTDRKQAFLVAFIEAKQHRYQLHQAQVAAHQQQLLNQFPKVYSSSVTLKLSQSSPQKLASQTQVNTRPQRSLRHFDSSDSQQQHQHQLPPSSYPGSASQRAARYHHQLQQAASSADFSARNPSATLVHQTSDSSLAALGILHQMSAPHSLTLTSSASPEERCSWSATCRRQKQQQSAAISSGQPTTELLSGQPGGISSATGDVFYCRLDSTTPIHTQLADRGELAAGMFARSHQPQLISNQMSSFATLDAHQKPPQLVFNVAPEFLLSLPMKFLHTQHPGLQFTCSAGRSISIRDATSTVPLVPDDPSRPQAALHSAQQQQQQQTVRDDSGQLWLCLSNGYISQVALLSIERKRGSVDESGKPAADDTKHSFNVSLVVQSTGDICKSHISCAAQVPRSTRHWRGLVRTLEVNNTSSNDSSTDNKPEAADRTATWLSSTGSSSTTNQQRQIKSINSLLLEPQSRAGSFRSRTVTVPASLLSGSRDIPSSSSDQAALPSEPPKANSFNTLRGDLSNFRVEKISGGAECQAQTHISAGPSSRPPSSTLTPQFLPNPERINLVNRSGFHSHLNHHQHRHHHHHHHHPHSHKHHLQHHPHPPANLYGARHNTVPLGELKKALESSQTMMRDRCASGGWQHQHHSSFYKQRNNHLAPPSNTPFDPMNISPAHHRINSLDLADQGLIQDSRSLHQLVESSKKARASTPPAAFSSIKGSRSARSLRHQASLKTSSILAKLVSSASKHYLRRSANSADKANQLEVDGTENRSTRGGSVDASPQPQVNLVGSRYRLAVDAEDAVISPLSSVSSLISSNSSVTVNSACASSPKHSSCDLLFHNTGASKCCSLTCQSRQGKDCGLRSRSATVPSPSSSDRVDVNRNTCSMENWNRLTDFSQVPCCSPNTYKVNEIIMDGEPPTQPFNQDERQISSLQEPNRTQQSGLSLWLGCDDGSLIVMDCLDTKNESTGEQNKDCSNNHCDNRHLEIKLAAAISDIKSYQEKLVFVALNNGQLAIFSKDESQQRWLMNSPKIITLASYELNFTSKICIIDSDHLWYSYGRNIFVLEIETLKLEITIMVPTNDPSIKYTMQPITIDNMEPMGENGVWISFKNSHLIQLYDTRSHKLMLELSLLEPVNKMLSYGNEILRQHKTSCLKATALLSLFNRKANCNTLFIGTSAGIILYLNMALDGVQVEGEGCLPHQQPLASLRHGHSGHINFLHLVSFIHHENNLSNGSPIEESIILISGGKGMDLYGPKLSTSSLPMIDNPQVIPLTIQPNSDEDNLNHMLLWRL